MATTTVTWGLEVPMIGIETLPQIHTVVRL